MQRRPGARGPQLGIGGVGSGYTANQELAGVAPAEAEAAARFRGLAAQDPESAERLAEQMRPDKETPEQETDLEEAQQKKAKEGEEKKTPEQGQIRFLRDATVQAGDLLRDPGVRDRVESRLKPLDIEEYLFHGYASQVVPILPGKLEVEFRSLSAGFMGWIGASVRDYLRKTNQTEEALEAEVLNVLGMRRLAACTYQLWIGGELAPLQPPLPRSDKRVSFFDVAARAGYIDLLDQRADFLYQRGDILADMLLVNLDWFFLRVRKMASELGGQLGNS